MIEIPEEKLLEDITDLLMNELPKVLLELEEQSEDGIRLPPFRYVGLEENLPVGTGLPYAFIDIEDGTYTDKDRVIKNVIYRINITLKIVDSFVIWQYFAGIKSIMGMNKYLVWRIELEKVNRNGLIILKFHTI